VTVRLPRNTLAELDARIAGSSHPGGARRGKVHGGRLPRGGRYEFLKSEHSTYHSFVQSETKSHASRSARAMARTRSDGDCRTSIRLHRRRVLYPVAVPAPRRSRRQVEIPPRFTAAPKSSRGPRWRETRNASVRARSPPYRWRRASRRRKSDWRGPCVLRRSGRE
jgi:hypothetical protein